MSGLSHTLGHTPMHCIAIQHCADIQAKQASQARPRPATQAQGPQSPSKAPRRPAKARKSPRLCHRIARQLCRLLGPLNRPHQNGANGPLDSMVKRVYSRTRTHTRSARVNTRVACAQAGAYGGIGVRRIGLGASHTRYKFSFYFPLGLGSAIRLAFHSRRASLSALQALSPCRSAM